MSFYNYQANVFVNNTQNPKLKMNDIQESVNLLYSVLMSGELVLPKLDYEYVDMLTDTSLVYQKMFTSMYTKEFEDGVAVRVGYNPSTIASSTPSNLADLLENVDDDYKSQIIQLSQIYRRLNKNIHHHKLVNYLFNDINQEFTTNQNLTKFKFTTECFEALFNKDPYTEGQILPDNVMAIPYIISYVLLFRIYSRAYNFPSNMLDDVYRNSFFADERIPSEFNKYITDYSSEISYSMADYLLSNVFQFGSELSLDIRDHLKNSISTMLPNMAQIFTDIKDDIIPPDFIFSFATDFNYHLITDTAFKHLNNDFYISLPMFWQIDPDTLNYYSMEQDKILAKFIEYINSNLETANDLGSISLSYTSNPLYFLNSFILTYSQFTLNFIQDYDCFSLNDVKSWISRYYTSSPNYITNLLSYIETHPLQYPGELFDHGCVGCTGDVGAYVDSGRGYPGCTGANPGSGNNCVPISRVPGPGTYNKSLEITSFLKFRQIILSYCDSSSFYSFVTKIFIPKISKTVNEKYFIEIDWYMEVDKIISFFKILLMKHLSEIDPDTGKFKLWGEFIDDFDVHTIHNIQKSTMNLSSGVLQNVLSVEMQNSQTYYYIFNSFMKSASMVKYLELQLKKNYSL